MGYFAAKSNLCFQYYFICYTWSWRVHQRLKLWKQSWRRDKPKRYVRNKKVQNLSLFTTFSSAYFLWVLVQHKTSNPNGSKKQRLRKKTEIIITSDYRQALGSHKTFLFLFVGTHCVRHYFRHLCIRPRSKSRLHSEHLERNLGIL